MSVRIATFNVENLMSRFDFSGFRNELRRDRTLTMLDVKSEQQYKQLEQARVVAHSDDTRQLTALAIADTFADIICLQEVENLEALAAFEYSYMFKMVGAGYRNKYLIEGNDSRGIDVAVMTRDETRDGEKIEFVDLKSHAHETYNSLDVFNNDLRAMDEKPHERVFRRDCLELDLRIGGKPITLYTLHLKSMGPFRNGMEGRDYTMPVRMAEAAAVRRIIERRWGSAEKAATKRWMICGDMNDYQQRTVISGDRLSGHHFEVVDEEISGVDPLLNDGFAVNLVERRPRDDRWTLYHARGPEERHLCQLDYLIASPELARRNPKSVPEIIRSGQPHRTPMPPQYDVERYPRTGWDRPKASDHCPVAVTLNLV